MNKPGFLTTLAIGDAFGACFEGLPARNDDAAPIKLEGYPKNPRWKTLGGGRYTDDAQMSLGLAEFLIATPDLKTATPVSLANYFVKAYQRDPRGGYMPGFRSLLESCADGSDFLARIRPHSDKSGAAMRDRKSVV
jgi:ADP-ribosylglycohydrolase